MNDRFKFRVWDETEEIMVYFDGVFYNKKPYTEGSSFPQYDSCPHYHKLSDLMQSTGLKDKNGKLIYEGDIVERSHISDVKRGRVFFDSTLLQFSATNMSLFSLVNRSVVIGNIYENPELLEN